MKTLVFYDTRESVKHFIREGFTGYDDVAVRFSDGMNSQQAEKLERDVRGVAILFSPKIISENAIECHQAFGALSYSIRVRITFLENTIEAEKVPTDKDPRRYAREQADAKNLNFAPHGLLAIKSEVKEGFSSWRITINVEKGDMKHHDDRDESHQDVTIITYLPEELLLDKKPFAGCIGVKKREDAINSILSQIEDNLRRLYHLPLWIDQPLKLKE